jgi:hypothetical protein
LTLILKENSWIYFFTIYLCLQYYYYLLKNMFFIKIVKWVCSFKNDCKFHQKRLMLLAYFQQKRWKSIFLRFSYLIKIINAARLEWFFPIFLSRNENQPLLKTWKNIRFI